MPHILCIRKANKSQLRYSSQIQLMLVVKSLRVVGEYIFAPLIDNKACSAMSQACIYVPCQYT